MTTPPVTIYSLSTCGWSRKAKAYFKERGVDFYAIEYDMAGPDLQQKISDEMHQNGADGFPYVKICLLYTSPSPRDRQKSRMPSSA